jgi:hypothetical protein
MRRAVALLGVTSAIAALAPVACRKTAPENAPAAADASADVAHSEELAAVLPPRCRLTPRSLAIDPAEAEIGDAQPFPGGIAVGVVHRTASGRTSAVALLPSGLESVRLLDLRPTLGDAPPPRLAWRGQDLLVAAYVMSSRSAKADAPRDVAVWAIDPTSPDPAGAAADREPLATLARQRGDSLSFDMAQAEGHALVVWDETTAGPTRASRRGVIRVEAVSDRAEPARDLVPPEPDADAEMPRVLPDGTGFYVLWVARKLEPAGASAARDARSETLDERRAAADPPAGREGEVTGEPRAFAWVEMVAVDAHGAPAGPVRRLTPATGHVSAFDVTVLAAAPKSPLIVVARDDGESADGMGGALLRVRAGADFADAPLELPTDGLGRGAPGIVPGSGPSRPSPPWLTWIDSRERLRLLPLDVAGAPAGRSSSEEPLAEARPLLSLDREQLLLARPVGDSSVEAKAELAVASCSR